MLAGPTTNECKGKAPDGPPPPPPSGIAQASAWASLAHHKDASRGRW